MQSTVPLGALLASLLLARGGMATALLAVGLLLVLPAVVALALGLLRQDRPGDADVRADQTAAASCP